MHGRRALPVTAVIALLVLGCSGGGPRPDGGPPALDGDPGAPAAMWPGGSDPFAGAGSTPWWSTDSGTDLGPTGVHVVARPGASSLAVDGAGAAWVHGPWHLARVDPGTGEGEVWDAGDDASLGEVLGIRGSAGSGVWLRLPDRIRLFDGTRFVRDLAVPAWVRDGPGGMLNDVVEVGDQVWVAGPAGVARWVAGTWALVRPEQLRNVTALATDDAGTVWAAGRLASDGRLVPAVVRFAGSGWEQPDAQRAPRAAHDLVAYQSGRVLVRYGTLVMGFDGTAWQRYPLAVDRAGDGALVPTSLAVSDEGTPWILGSGGLLRVGPHGWAPMAGSERAGLVGVATAGGEVLVASAWSVLRVREGTLEEVWSEEPRGPTMSAAGLSEGTWRGPAPWAEGEVLPIQPEGLVAVSRDEVWVLPNSYPFVTRWWAIPNNYPFVTRWSGESWDEWQLSRALWVAPVLATDGAAWIGTRRGVVRVAGGDARRFGSVPVGGRARPGPDGSVWILPSEWYGWWYADGYEEDEPEYRVIRRVQPDGTATVIPMPDYPWSIGPVVAGPGGELWTTICTSGDVDSCPDPPDLLRWDDSWAPVPYPSVSVEPIGVSPDGGLWAVLGDNRAREPAPGAAGVRVLARYVDGRWSTLLESGVPEHLVTAPGGSVCGVVDVELLCVDRAGRATRLPVGLSGEVRIAPDGAVWLVNEGLVARLDLAVTG